MDTSRKRSAATILDDSTSPNIREESPSLNNKVGRGEEDSSSFANNNNYVNTQEQQQLQQEQQEETNTLERQRKKSKARYDENKNFALSCTKEDIEYCSQKQTILTIGKRDFQTWTTDMLKTFLRVKCNVTIMRNVSKDFAQKIAVDFYLGKLDEPDKEMTEVAAEEVEKKKKKKKIPAVTSSSSSSSVETQRRPVVLSPEQKALNATVSCCKEISSFVAVCNKMKSYDRLTNLVEEKRNLEKRLKQIRDEIKEEQERKESDVNKSKRSESLLQLEERRKDKRLLKIKLKIVNEEYETLKRLLNFRSDVDDSDDDVSER